MLENQLNLVSITEAKDMIRMLAVDAFTKNKRTPRIMLKGGPGIGKTAIMKQIRDEIVADENNTINNIRFCEPPRLGDSDPAEILGYPYNQEGELIFSTPSWFPYDLEEDEYAILFLDELTNAGKSAQHAAYQLIHEARIQNGKRLSDRVLIVSAGNGVEHNTGARSLLPAMANRFDIHLAIDERRVADPAIEYFMESGFSIDIIGYLSWRKESVYQLPSIKTPSDAFPTPRTWESVNGFYDVIKSPSALKTAIAGAVGTEVAVDFFGYLEYKGRLPEWSRLRRDPTYTYEIPKNDKGLECAIAVTLALQINETLRGGLDSETDRLGGLLESLSTELKIVTFKTMKRDKEALKLTLNNRELSKSFDEVKPYILQR